MENFFINFREAKNNKELAEKYIGISHDLFEHAISKDKTMILPKTTELDFINGFRSSLPKYYNCYCKHHIPKKSRKSSTKYRVVWEVTNDELETAYKNLARKLNIFINKVNKDFPFKFAYGYIKGKNTLDNAKNHCGAKLLLNADIKNFFPSIKIKNINSKFIELAINPDISMALSKFVTINGELPLGLPTSPVISNLIFLNLDKKLQALSEKYNCSYSRYADDISISGHLVLPSKEEIKSILKDEEFELNEDKFTTKKIGQAQFVTGLSTTDIKYPHVPRKMKKKLRQEIHYCDKFGIEEHLNYKFILKEYGYYNEQFGHKINPIALQIGVNRIDGMVRYVANIEGNSPFNFCSQWQNLLKKYDLEPSYNTLEERKPKNIEFYIDETEITINDKKFLALCFVKINDADEISKKTDELTNSTISDPFYYGSKEALRKIRMHYNDAIKDLRTQYIKILSVYHYKSYLIYGELKSQKDYANLYISFINKVFPHRLMGCDRDNVNIVFEENPRVKEPLIATAINNIYNRLEKANNRRPIRKPIVEIKTKKECACVSIPDFLLGVFSNYVKNDKIGTRHLSHFEKLRDKYRLIINLDTNNYFSRKNTFYHENF